MSNWIDVNNQLPSKDGVWYLIVNGGMTTMAFYEKNLDDVYWLCHNDKGDSDEWDEVTHWQPLPEPPK